jgi:hypothetical protein
MQHDRALMVLVLALITIIYGLGVVSGWILARG